MTEEFWNFHVKIGGTAGGAVTVFTPTLMAATPSSCRIGMIPWVMATIKIHSIYKCDIPVDVYEPLVVSN